MKKYAVVRKVKHATANDNARCPLCGHRWHDCHCAAEALDDYVDQVAAEAAASEVKRQREAAKLTRLATRRACNRNQRDRMLAIVVGEQTNTSSSDVKPELDNDYVRISGITLDALDVYERDAIMAHA